MLPLFINGIYTAIDKLKAAPPRMPLKKFIIKDLTTFLFYHSFFLLKTSWLRASWLPVFLLFLELEA